MATDIVFEISRSDLEDLAVPVSASITNVKPLSSYNWIEAPHATPTMSVPGSPALWAPPNLAPQLKKDSGLIYIAQNAARHPESPLEPLFRSLYISQPRFDIRPINFVSDRNNIRKLLSLINSETARNVLEAFTIIIEMSKDTALFCRDEAETTEFIGPQDFKGFGHEFEKAYTIDQIKGSTGHHRITSYCFGDLNFIVRHETDGYVNTNKSTSSGLPFSENDLSGMLGALSLSPSSDNTPDVITKGSTLTIREEGQTVALESILEIKTRVSHKPLRFEEVASQL